MKPDTMIFPRWLKVALVLSMLALVAGGAWFYRVQKQAMLYEAEENLNTIARLKANQIAAWRFERLGDANVLSKNEFFVSGVVRFLSSRTDENTRAILAYLRSLQVSYHYADILIVDPDGKLLLSLNGIKRPYNAYASALATALHDRTAVFISLHIGTEDRVPHFSVVAPLFSGAESARKPVGAAIMVIDASQFLYPLIQSWPTSSKTAETLLVRRDGDDVLFLNELRHQTDTALKLRIPLSRRDLPASMAILGQKGIVIGKDYRGVEVVSAILAVPESPWFMVAKVDAAEVFADWRHRSALIVAFILGVMFLIVTTGLLLWQREKKAHYRTLYLSEAAFRSSVERHSVTLKSIGDAVIATDARGMVELLNPVAEALTGWQDTEARGKPLQEVFCIVNEDTGLKVEDPVSKVLREGTVVGLANHTLLISRDGSRRPIADSGAPIRNEINEITGVVLVFRDQTEERWADRMSQIRSALIEFAATHTLEELLTKALDDINILIDSPIGFIHFVEDDQTTLSLQRWSSRTLSEFCRVEGKELHYSIEQAGVWADCARQKKPIIHNDYASLKNKKGTPEGHAVIIREIVVPTIRKDKVVAIVGLGNKPTDYTEKDAESLNFLADMIWELVERKRVEEALGQSEHRLRILIDAIPDLFWLKDQNGIYLLCNKAFERFFGAKETDIIGKTDHDFVDKDLADFFREHDRKAMAAGRPSMNEESLAFADGSRNGVFETLKTPIYDVNGALIGVLGISRDISDRKRAEKSLREKEQRYVSAQRMGRVGNWEYDVISETFWGSDEAKRIYGFDEQSSTFTVDDIENCIPERERVHQALVDLIERDKPYDLEFKILPIDGSSPKIIRSIAQLIRDASGTPAKIMGVIHDITEQKAADNERLRLEHQLHQAQKMESVGRLAGGVAHDYNNMLSVIIGFTELAFEKTAPDDLIRQDLNEVLDAAQRSTTITRQLLAFARRQAIAPKVLDLNETIEAMLKMLRRLIGEDIDLSWQPGSGRMPVFLDPSQIDQLLVNLCINARDAIGGVGKLTIETGRARFDTEYCDAHAGLIPGDFVMLAVSDDGCGMDKDTIDNIFEPFFTTKGVGEGTGLGLSTVFGIVKQNNGFINVYSEPGKGTTFKIYLPPHAEEGAIVKMSEAVNIPTGRGETVLIVEDEASILKLSQQIIENLGYHAMAASTPGEALALADEHVGDIHLLVTDVVMPEMNGRELAEKLQSHYPTLKVLFVSGYTANVIAHRGVLDKGVNFIQKPFSKNDLAVKMREALEKSAT
jgi:PAS domain S-box-containing protein